MTETNERDKAFQAWWKSRIVSVVPSMRSVATIVAEQAWTEAWNHRDRHGPSEIVARAGPLVGDTWLKHSARGVKITRRVTRRPWSRGRYHYVTFEERRGFDPWVLKPAIQIDSFRAWTQTASLTQRGQA